MKDHAARLVDFARPMLDLLGDNPKPDQVRRWFQIAIDVWNAVTVEDWQGRKDAVPLAKAEILGEHPELIDLFDRLVARRRESIAEANWGVIAWDLGEDDQGQFRLSLEVKARDASA